MNNQILLIGDMVSACKVALSAMVPVLTAKGHQPFCLPTAMVSNTFGYKKVAQVSTGDYVKKSLAAWDEMDISFDGIFAGYVTEEKQAESIIDYCMRQSARGVKIFHDPIIGEDGHLYYGMDETIAACHRKIMAVADFTMPSYTEAAYIAGKEYKDNISPDEIYEIMDILASMGAKNIIITSCVVNSQWCCACLDCKTGAKALLTYDYVDKKVGGTGDVFSACVIGNIMNGMDFLPAVQSAMDIVRSLIIHSIDKEDWLRGVELEKYMNEI